MSFVAFFGFDKALPQIVRPLAFLRRLFFLIRFVVVRKRLRLGTISIVSFTIRLLFHILLDAGVPTFLSVSFLEDSWLFGGVLEDIFELYESIPFLSEAGLHLIQVFLYIACLVGTTHLLLEQPRL
jgi:hypothetical protein